jgi:flavin-dependent dehydrogenase
VETALPFEGLGLSRRVLDEALLTHAAGCGADISRGVRINNISTAGGIALETATLGVIRPRTLFLATGKHELRGLRRDTAKPNTLVGFKMYFRLSPRAIRELSGYITLYMFRRGYAGLQMVEGGQANLCLLVEKDELDRARGTWLALLERLCEISPHLHSALADATPLLDQPLSIYRVPYGFIHHPTAADPAQVFRLGDQAGVIPSFTGDGMAIALHSAALAASTFLHGGTAAAYHKQLERELKGQIGRASAIYGLASSRPSQAVFFSLTRIFPKLLAIGASLTRVEPERLIFG